MIVEVATDNTNRSAADIRGAFTKNNGNLGSSNSVTYLFEQRTLRLWLINAGYYVALFTIMGTIIGALE